MTEIPQQGLNEALVMRVVSRGGTGVAGMPRHRFITTGDTPNGARHGLHGGFLIPGSSDGTDRTNRFVTTSLPAQAGQPTPRVVDVTGQPGHDVSSLRITAPNDTVSGDQTFDVIEPNFAANEDVPNIADQIPHTQGRRKGLRGPALLLTGTALVAGCASNLSGNGAATSESTVQAAMTQTLNSILPRVDKFRVTQGGNDGPIDVRAGQEVTLSADTAEGGQLIITAILNKVGTPVGATVEEVTDIKPGYTITLRDPLYSGNLAGPQSYTGEEDTSDSAGDPTGQTFTYSDQDGEFVAGPSDVKEAQRMTAQLQTDVDEAMRGKLIPDDPQIVGY